MSDEPRRVIATQSALNLIELLQKDYGEILFHQSGGCCDGSSPMCYPKNEFVTGQNDVKLGEIGGVCFYIGASQFECWKHTQLIVDVVAGQGGMFSLENGTGKRFHTRSRIFSDAELLLLAAKIVN